MVCTAEGDDAFELSTPFQRVVTPCCEGLEMDDGNVCRGPDYEPPAPECRMPEPAAGGTDCWALSDYFQANDLPQSDCSKYFDTYNGGRGCRIENGRCDGFDDEPFTPCPGEEIEDPCNGETDPNSDCWRRLGWGLTRDQRR